MTKPQDVPGLNAPRTRFLQPVTKKAIQDGDSIGTCGHVTQNGKAYLFDGFWTHEDQTFVFLACCQDCAEKSGFDLANVAITQIVSTSQPS